MSMVRVCLHAAWSMATVWVTLSQALWKRYFCIKGIVILNLFVTLCHYFNGIIMKL